MSHTISPSEVERRRGAALQQPGAVVRNTGLIKFQCPACRTEGHDRHQDNACLFGDGSFGCAVGRDHWGAGPPTFVSR
jgi:hypothetical protein